MKPLSLEQSLSQILSQPQPKAKLTLATVWPKVQPFLLMLAMLVPGLSKYIDALISGIQVIIDGTAKAFPAKLIATWAKVRPFVVMLAGLFGKKVGVYINAFIAAIDKIVEED